MGFNFNWSAVSGGAPYVTLTSLGISLNSFSIAKLGTPQQVIVGFDEEQCVIGIKAYADEPDVKPYDFSEKIKNGSIRLGCRDFIKYLSALTDIDFTKAKRYIASYDASGGVLTVHVKGESEAGESGEADDKTE